MINYHFVNWAKENIPDWELIARSHRRVTQQGLTNESLEDFTERVLKKLGFESIWKEYEVKKNKVYYPHSQTTV